MAKDKTTQEQRELIVALLEELRHAEMFEPHNVPEVKKALARAGYQAEKPSKRAEQRPAAAGRAEQR